MRRLRPGPLPRSHLRLLTTTPIQLLLLYPLYPPVQLSLLNLVLQWSRLCQSPTDT
jgi:hypothetical protein